MKDLILLLFLFFNVLILIHIYGLSYYKKKNFEKKWVTLKIYPKKEEERNPNLAEQFLSSLYSIYEKRTIFQKLLGKKQEEFSLEIANINGLICFYVRIPKEYKSIASGQFYANYPDVEIEEIDDYTLRDFKNSSVSKMELELSESDIWPIKRYSMFEDKMAKTVADPIAGIIFAMSDIKKNDEEIWLQIACMPQNSLRFRFRAAKLLNIISKGCFGNHPNIGSYFEKKYMEMDGWKRILNTPILALLSFFRFGGKGIGKIKIGNENENEEEQEVEEMIMTKRHDKEDKMTASSDKISRLCYNVNIRALYITDKKKSKTKIQRKLREFLGAFKQFNVPHLNGFEKKEIILNQAYKQKILNSYRNIEINHQMILNCEELATIYHMPNLTVAVPNIDWITFKKLEPQQNIPKESEEKNLAVLGKTTFRGKTKTFGIKKLDRRRHIYVIGKTGMGKSTILENMLFDDIQKGKGVAVVDPHGDLADAVINFVPENRIDDVIIFDPSDKEHPISFNVLSCKNEEHKDLIASEVIGVFKKMFAESWGPRLEHILRNTILALIEVPDTSMLGIMKMLADKQYRNNIIQQVKDPMVLSFWKDEFGSWQPRQVAEAASPIQNKVGQFLSSSAMRNILGQTKSSIDFREAMDTKKIVIVNLSKGKIGEDNSALLGSMIITKFQIDAMSRASIPEKDREDFYLYVDEFQNFATDSFATILSEARKYHLNLTVANQYLEQMPEEVRNSVFGNVGSMISFQVGFDDAEFLSKQFAEIITAYEIGDLPKYHAYIRLMIDGMPSRAFSAKMLPPPEFTPNEKIKAKIISTSRKKYTVSKKEIEKEIALWSQNSTQTKKKVKKKK